MQRPPIRSAVASGRHALSMSAFLGPRQQEIEAKLSAAFSPLHLQIDNESHGRKEDECAPACPTQTSRPGSFVSPFKCRRSHFKVVVVSEAFADKRLVARHRLINGVLLDESGTLPFHSLSIAAAKTPAEWGMNTEVPASPTCMGGDGSGLQT